MFTYCVNFHDCGSDMVRTGRSTPFDKFQTGCYKTARREAILWTVDNPHCSAVIHNRETGNRVYIEDGMEK